MVTPSVHVIHNRSIAICQILSRFPKRSVSCIHRRSLQLYRLRERLTLGTVSTRLKSPNSLFVPISLKTDDLKSISTHALLDSGAQGNFIHRSVVEQHNLPTSLLKQPIELRNADASLNADHLITRSVDAQLITGPNSAKIKFLVANIGKSSAILGYPWLRQENPIINWRTSTIHLNPPDTNPKPMMLSQVASAPKPLPSLARNPPSCTLPPASKSIPAPSHTSVEINATSPSTRLAAASPSTKVDDIRALVPEEFHDFLDIFSEEASQRLPSHKQWDHEINLKPSFSPRSAKVYPLSPEEERLTKEMIDEHLA